MKPLNVQHPLWLFGLIGGCLLTATLGFWFVFHQPLRSSAAVQSIPPVQIAQQTSTPPAQAPHKLPDEQKSPQRPFQEPQTKLAPISPEQPTAKPQQGLESIVADHGIAIGGNAQVQSPTVNNYGPPERHLTQAQKDGLVALAAQIPKECTVFFGSGDTAEPQTFAREMHDVWATVGTTRDPGWVYGWHPKGIYLEVKSADEPCAQYGKVLVDGMGALGLTIVGANINPKLSNNSELQVLVGDP